MLQSLPGLVRARMIEEHIVHDPALQGANSVNLTFRGPLG
jgi:hypothetical protein